VACYGLACDMCSELRSVRYIMSPCCRMPDRISLCLAQRHKEYTQRLT